MANQTTPSMTTYRRAEIVLVAFPLTEGTQTKRRPALVVLDTGDADLTLARITSRAFRGPFDVEVVDWRGAGLRFGVPIIMLICFVSSNSNSSRSSSSSSAAAAVGAIITANPETTSTASKDRTRTKMTHVRRATGAFAC